MVLNEKESRILNFIKEDPFISQQDLAEKIGLSRPAVANIISSLVKRGYLLGKAYVINETRPIVCIGAAAIDRRYFVEDELVQGQGNNVTSQTSIGGVALSTAENLGRLQQDVVLLTLYGNDSAWNEIEETVSPYMRLNEAEMVPGYNTGMFMEVLDKYGKMIINLAEMEIFDQLTPEWVSRHISTLKHARVIIIDSNVPKETAELIIEVANKYKIPVVYIVVSILKVKNIPDKLNGVMLFMAKLEESAAALQLPAQTPDDLRSHLQSWLDRGVEHVVLTDRNHSLLYGSDEYGKYTYTLGMDNESSYIWGTNEAFVGGAVYSFLNDGDLVKALLTGIVNAQQTAHSVYKVRPNLTQATLLRDVKNYGDLHVTETLEEK